MAKASVNDPAQEELPLSAVLTHTLFPGRTALRCEEVAHAVGVKPRHIRNLCADGTIIGAFSISNDRNEKRVGYWRIPVSAYDAWIRRKSNIDALQG